jgi:hypothetical protein
LSVALGKNVNEDNVKISRWWGSEDSNLQPNDYQLLAYEVPEVVGVGVYERFVSVNSRLNINETVSAV